MNNLQEVALGTDLNNPDTDNDGLSDGTEVGTGRNPRLNEGAIILLINGILAD